MTSLDTELLVRLGSAVVLGGAIGYERELRQHPAGLRTHLLVSLASATFGLVSFQAGEFQHGAAGALARYDPGRIASNVVVGIGFLGGGAILRHGTTVKGLTTAASLWLVAAVGLASGAGMIALAFAATVTSLLVLVVLWRVVEVPRGRVVRLRVRIDTEGDLIGRAALAEFVAPAGAAVTDVDYQRDLTRNRSRIVVGLTLPDAAREEPLMRRLETLPGLRRVRVQRP